MAVSNEVIAESFSLLSRLMDIHGENPFKIKSYAAASFSIDKLTEELHAIPREKIISIKGIISILALFLLTGDGMIMIFSPI